jgi:hypothetical protein
LIFPEARTAVDAVMFTALAVRVPPLVSSVSDRSPQSTSVTGLKKRVAKRKLVNEDARPLTTQYGWVSVNGNSVFFDRKVL